MADPTPQWQSLGKELNQRVKKDKRMSYMDAYLLIFMRTLFDKYPIQVVHKLTCQFNG